MQEIHEKNNSKDALIYAEEKQAHKGSAEGFTPQAAIEKYINAKTHQNTSPKPSSTTSPKPENTNTPKTAFYDAAKNETHTKEKINTYGNYNYAPPPKATKIKTIFRNNSLLQLFNRVKKKGNKGITAFMRTIAEISLIKIGDFLLLLDSRFQKKKYYRLTLILTIVSLTWVITAIFTFFTNSDSSNTKVITANTQQEISTYTPTSKSSSLKPLQDYYLFQNKLDIENMSDMIISSAEKDKELKKLYNVQMKNDLQNTEVFQQSDRIIQNEIKKLIQ